VNALMRVPTMDMQMLLGPDCERATAGDPSMYQIGFRD
jgi:hypothetical protein